MDLIFEVEKLITVNYIWPHRNTIECVDTVIGFGSSKQKV